MYEQTITYNWGKSDIIQDEDLLSLAKEMNIKKAKDNLYEVRTSISKWITFAETIRVDKKLRDEIHNFFLV